MVRAKCKKPLKRNNKQLRSKKNHLTGMMIKAIQQKQKTLHFSDKKQNLKNN